MLENTENRHCGCSCPMNNNDNMIIDNGYQNSMAMPASFGMKTSACNCCCEQHSTPSIETYSFNFTNYMPEDTCPEREETREEMIQNIRCLDFAVVELALYLDTHEDDEKALYLHKEYATKLKELKEKYQKVYGPLSNKFPCNKWRWLEEPWPWERGNY